MKRALSALLCVGIMLSILIAYAGGFTDDYDAIEATAASVLYIETDDDYDPEFYFSGSGFVAFNDRTFVTNYHVIEDVVSIKVYDEYYSEYPVGDILAVDKERDIAILTFKSSTGLKPLMLAENPELKRGQPISAIGYPKGLYNTFSTGIISAIIDYKDTTEIQFTAPISQGSSGGALFNDRGEVIGITTSLIEDGQNINYAIDISHVITLYKLYDSSYTSYAWFVPESTSPTKETLPPPSPSPKPRLPIPYGLTGTAIYGKVSLTWFPTSGAEKYSIYRSISDDSNYRLIATISEAAYIDVNVLPGRTYYYRIAGSNSQTGLSEKSNYIKVYLAAFPATSTPIPTPRATLSPIPTKTPTPSPSSLITSEEIAKYKTLKAGMNDPDVARLKERMYELGYFKHRTVNNSFTEATAEYVKEFQRANGFEADGIASPEMQALFFSECAISKPTPVVAPKPTPKPKAPTNLKAKTTSGRAVLTWSASKGASSFEIYRANSANGTYIKIGVASKPTFTDNSSIRGKTYYYRVTSIYGTSVSSDKSDYIKVVMPKPTPTPFVEPKYPLDFGNDGYVGTARNPYLNPKIVNISKTKTVDGFTLIYYCTNVYGDKLYFDDSKEYTSEYTYNKSLKPGQSTYPGKVSLDLYGHGIKRIYVAIQRIHTTDGRTYDIPESQLEYYYWTVD